MVVIDFGMIYLGYVFLLKDGWEKEFLKINLNVWNVGIKCLLFLKVLIIFLLNFDKSFLFFGYDVEIEYLDMVENGKNF